MVSRGEGGLCVLGKGNVMRLIGLLSRLHPRSFGMAPAVIEDETTKTIRVVGLAKQSSHRGRLFEKADFEQLVIGGHAKKVFRNIKNDIGDSETALWLGEQFTEACSKINLPLPPFPKREYKAKTGVFFIGTASGMYAYLESWIVKAFDLFRKEKDIRKEIATLMRWTLPDHPATLAASWLTSPNKEQEIKWQINTFGNGIEIDAWRTKLERVVENLTVPFSKTRIIAFTGRSGTRRNEAAKAFAEMAKGVFRSFVIPLEKKLPARFDQRKKKKLLMEIGQQEVERYPLPLTLAALENGTGDGKKTVIIDSVRHKKIYQVLNWLGAKEVVLFGVSALEERTPKRKLEPILGDPTEIEIPGLIKRAVRVVDDNSPFEKQLKDLVAFIQE